MARDRLSRRNARPVSMAGQILYLWLPRFERRVPIGRLPGAGIHARDGPPGTWAALALGARQFWRRHCAFRAKAADAGGGLPKRQIEF